MKESRIGGKKEMRGMIEKVNIQRSRPSKHREAQKKPKEEKARLLQDMASVASVPQKAGPSPYTGCDTHALSFREVFIW